MPLNFATAKSILEDTPYKDNYLELGRKYRHKGYGGSFQAWLYSHDPQPFLLPVPVTVIREAGSLAVSVKATANDDSAIVTAGWFGYYETIAPDTDLDA